MYSVFGISFSDYPKPKPFSPHLSHYCSVPSPHLSNLHRFTVNNFKMCFPFLFSFRKSITFLEWVKFVERIYWRGTWTVCGSNFLRTMQCFQELGAYLQSKKCLIFSPKDQFLWQTFYCMYKSGLEFGEVFPMEEFIHLRSHQCTLPTEQCPIPPPTSPSLKLSPIRVCLVLTECLLI